MSLETRLTALATRIGQECKAIRAAAGGDTVSAVTTADQAAIGTAVASGQIGNAGGTTVRLLVVVRALVKTTATSGTIALLLNASAAGGVVPKAGSYYRWRKVA